MDAIVVASFGATYEWAAREEAHARGLALLTGREFFGALNHRDLMDHDLNHAVYFIQRIGSHQRVVELHRVEAELFFVERDAALGDLLVFSADEYRLGESFVLDVARAHPEVQVITNLSAWNDYTPEADLEARRHGMRVFDLSGIYGALNLDNERIATYTPAGR